MRNTGRGVILLIFIFLISGAAYAAEIKSEITRHRIRVGESTTLKVMISGSTSDIRPVKVPALEGIDIVFSGSSRSFQFINGKSWTGIILSFTIRGERKGVYRISPFIIEADGEKLQTREFVLTVDEGDGPPAQFQASGDIRGEVDITAEEVYAGEPLIMRYYLTAYYSGIEIEGMKESPESRGFLIKPLKEGELGMGDELPDGRVYIGSYCLVAAESGRHSVGGGSLSLLSGSGRGFFSRVVMRDLRFPEKKVKVKPLPQKGMPEKFNGDVGDFSISAGEPSGTFRAGEEIRIPVTVKGRGNFIMMSKPLVENQEGLRTLVEESEPVLSVDGRTLSGEKTYTVTVIPESEGECLTGKIYLAYFNPFRGVYERAETGPFRFDIRSPAVNENKSAVKAGDKESPLSFPVILLTGAVLLIIISIGALLFQTGRYRIVKAENLQEKKPDPEPAAEDKVKQLKQEVEHAFASEGYQAFLLYAERFTAAVFSETRELQKRDELSAVRERINLYRYGGAVPVEQDLREIYITLKKFF